MDGRMPVVYMATVVVWTDCNMRKHLLLQLS